MRLSLMLIFYSFAFPYIFLLLSLVLVLLFDVELRNCKDEGQMGLLGLLLVSILLLSIGVRCDIILIRFCANLLQTIVSFILNSYWSHFSIGFSPRQILVRGFAYFEEKQMKC